MIRGATKNPNAKAVFATEGVLLKMLCDDFLLKDFSCIVLDEAHERTQSMDVIIGCLSRVVLQRRKLFEEQLAEKKVEVTPLKLILMSATIDENIILNENLFKKKPSIISL